MAEYEILAVMLRLLGVLTLGGFIILSRDLREISKLSKDIHDLTRQVLTEVRR
jgi:hypothetical protein